MAIGEGATWTVLAGDYRVAEPAEQYLEYLRSTDSSPNTIKSYARASPSGGPSWSSARRLGMPSA
ncbi:hypothetical protein NKH18_13850 [Streptomyces sp. M10(2022)]